MANYIACITWIYIKTLISLRKKTMKQLLIISIIAGMFLSIEMRAFAHLKPVANIIAKPNDGG